MEPFRPIMTLYGLLNQKSVVKSVATHVIVDGEWEGEKITKTNCYVDPTATSNEVGLYQEKNK